MIVHRHYVILVLLVDTLRAVVVEKFALHALVLVVLIVAVVCLLIAGRAVLMVGEVVVVEAVAVYLVAT